MTRTIEPESSVVNHGFGEQPRAVMTPRRVPAVVQPSLQASLRVRPVGMSEVRLQGGFWAERQCSVVDVTLPALFEQCEKSGRLDNFRRAAGTLCGGFTGKFYADSDVYKTMEAAAWAMVHHPVPALAEALDELIVLVAAAQSPDGYLNTFFSVDREDERFTDLAVMHEMYCVGHLIQAAVAHHRLTGRPELLTVACRAADHLGAVFGPGRRPGVCGHPGIEMALVELFRDTADERYLSLASWFIEQHGQQPPTLSGNAYHQDHQPLASQREAVNHAVRALYLYCAGADADAETGDSRYSDALSALWTDVYSRKMYITGGLGSRWELEAFGDAYELPNHRGYAETCAAIASVMWNWRLHLATGEARFGDEIERALYNAILPGMSLGGDEFFYQNPLADEGTHRREPWFVTACCPPNIARLISSIQGYIYSTDDDTVFVNQYITSAATLTCGDQQLRIELDTCYPDQGEIRLTVCDVPPRALTFKLRVPAWATSVVAQLNDADIEVAVVDGWGVVTREWTAGDMIQLRLDLTPRLVQAHPRVSSLGGRAALCRGPIVYCVESADNPSIHPSQVSLSPRTEWTERRHPELPCLALSGKALISAPAVDRPLYGTDSPAATTEMTITAIPYWAWANRSPGPMSVWLRHTLTTAAAEQRTPR